MNEYLRLAQERGGLSKDGQWENESNMRWHIDLLYWLTKSLKPKIIVELGTFVGGSFYCFLAGIVENNMGHIYTVDIINRSEFLQEASENAKFFTHVVGDSKTIVNIPNIDFLFIDSNHSYEQVKAEWDKWERWVKVGGLVFFHDTKLVDSHGRPYGIVHFVKEIWKKEHGRFVRLYNLGADVEGDKSGLEVWIKLSE